MSSFDSPKTPNKTEGTVKTPDTGATIMDTEDMDTESPTNEYCQNLETINEKLLRENKRLKQELDYYRPKPGETPSTVLQIRHNNTEHEYYALDLVPYTTEHRDKNLPVRNEQGERIGGVDMKGNLVATNLTDDLNAEPTDDLNAESKKRKRGGNKKSRKRGGNKKSCKRTKKR